LNFLQNGVPVSERGRNGRTLLQEATYHGSAECLLILLEFGANVNDVDDHLRSPLHIFSPYVEEKNPICFTILIQRGASLNAKDINGYTPLHMAADDNLKKHIIVLLENGADPYLKNNDGQTFLDLLSEEDQREILKIIGDYESLEIKTPEDC
jgi:tankyrase